MKTLAIIFFLAASNSSASPLVIRFSDMPLSVGFLRVEQFPETGDASTLRVMSEQFEEFRIAHTSEEQQRWVEGLQPSTGTPTESQFFFFEPNYQGNPSNEPGLTLDDPATGRYFTFWKDRAFETSTHPLVVWKKNKESLVLETVLDRAILVGIGLPSLNGIVHLGEGRHLLVGETCGGDGGDTWGSVWIALWSEPRKLKILYEISDQSCMNTPQKLEYHFDRKSKEISFKRLTKAADIPDVDSVKNESPWHLEKAWSVKLNTELK